MLLTKNQVLANLRAEIARANADYEACTELCKQPYATTEIWVQRREALARAGGIAKCIEIVQEMT